MPTVSADRPGEPRRIVAESARSDTDELARDELRVLESDPDGPPSDPADSEMSNLAQMRAKLDIREREAQVERQEDETAFLRERRRYARQLWIFIVCWCLAVLVLITAQGLEWIALSDAVLIALITTTTANVLFLFHFVARHLYKGDHPAGPAS